MAAPIAVTSSAAVDVVLHQQVHAYIMPGAETDGTPSLKSRSCALMAFLSSWMMWLDHLPANYRSDDLPLLFSFVLSLNFKLSVTFGRIELRQRLDRLREARLSPDVLSMYDVFLGSLSSELERCGPRILQYWLNLNVADGIVFDQLVHAILHFGLGCADFNALDEKAFKLMFDFAGTLATAVNGPQTMESEAENPPSDSEPLALDQQ